jgi:hypothetical protein
MTAPFPSRRGPGGGDGGSEESRPEDHALLTCPAPRHQQTQATANTKSHGQVSSHFPPVFWIQSRFRIRRVRKFLGLQEPDPDPDPSINKQKKFGNALISTILSPLWLISELLPIFEDCLPAVSNKQKTKFLFVSWKPLTKRAESGSGSVIQSTVRIQGPGSVSKCYGSGKLFSTNMVEISGRLQPTVPVLILCG